MRRVGETVKWLGFRYVIQKVKASGKFYAVSVDSQSGRWLEEQDLDK